jgi:hypothetical protein
MKTLILKSILCSVITLSSAPIFAQLTVDFTIVASQTKGPFELNYLQGTKSRVPVKSGGAPSGKFLFQAAFRNEVSRGMEQNYNFYTGNLFTTNYYELMGEYVYGDSYGSHDLDHQTLMSVAPAAMTKATVMVQNWVLEKYFNLIYSETTYAKSFTYRGISGSEFEQEYAIYFFNFYLSSMSGDYQYLPVFLLAKESPIAESQSLATARQLIAESYDYFANVFPANSKKLTDLRAIRNAIHNQLSEKIIGMISDYLAENPWYEKEGNTYLQKIQVLLKDYYGFKPFQVVALANKANLLEVATAAEEVDKQGVTPSTILNLSIAVANAKTAITQSEIPYQNKANALSLIVKSCQFINKEISRMDVIDSNDVMMAILNTIYSEGFLIFDNWEYYKSQISIGNVQSSKALMAEIIDIASATLEESFTDSYPLWVSISPDEKFKNFMDDTIKSSSLNTASISVGK